MQEPAVQERQSERKRVKPNELLGSPRRPQFGKQRGLLVDRPSGLNGETTVQDERADLDHSPLTKP